MRHTYHLAQILRAQATRLQFVTVGDPSQPIRFADASHFLCRMLLLLRPAGVLEGVQVETTVSEIDIFVSPTSIITLDHMDKLKNNTLVGNTKVGHFDNEIDLAGSEGVESTKVGSIVLQKIVSHYPFATGCSCRLQARQNFVPKSSMRKWRHAHSSLEQFIAP